MHYIQKLKKILKIKIKIFISNGDKFEALPKKKSGNHFLKFVLKIE